jgi:hypothetical protein
MNWVYFLAVTALCYWVIFRDGAKILEGWAAAVVFELFAAILAARYLRAYAAIVWVVCLISFLRSVFAGEQA